jgi:hypothetical protein
MLLSCHPDVGAFKMTEQYFQPCAVAGRPLSMTARMKEMQAKRIGDLREALVASGRNTLAQQAAVLGLGRSTCWEVLRAAHKGSGLSASILSRMLSSPTLPSGAREVILQYIDEKSRGMYGHQPRRIRQFQAQLQSLYRSQFDGRAAPSLVQARARTKVALGGQQGISV